MDTKNCKICGKVMERGYRTKAYFETRKFCSQVCYHKSDESKVGKYKDGHEGLAGDKNPSWNGGITAYHSGYLRVKLPEPKKYRPAHRFVMEHYLGRELLTEEQVHHKNGNKADNRIENLEVLSRSEHGKLHARSNKFWEFSKTWIDSKRVL